MNHDLTIRIPDTDAIDTWLGIHRSVYSKYPWPAPITRAQITELISSPEIHTMIAYSANKPIGIAALENDSESHKITLKQLVCLEPSSSVKEFLKHIITKSKEMGAKCVNTWIWDSERDTLRGLIDAGFAIEMEHSLISREVSEIPDVLPQDSLAIRSLSEGVTIPDFVAANREAFKDDPSDFLEESELEGWISKEKGFNPKLQLAALYDGAIVGTLMSEMFSFTRPEGTEQHAWIHGLGVIEAFRRRGIARGLVRELLKRLKEFSIIEVWLFTDTTGPIREFYDRLDFQQQTNFVDLTLYFDKP